MGGASSRNQEGETSDCLENQTVESSNSSFFTEEELNKLKSDYETGGVELVKTVLQRKVTELDNTELNVAVTGESGAGKSSFINAMRGLQSNDEGAAEVGSIETTKEPTGYQHPNLPNVCFWDLPGIGTKKFPANKYLNEMKFKKYDFFIIISRCRFTENDTILAKEIKRLGKNFYFVRSKIDNDLYSKRRGGGIFNEEEELVEIREDCVSKLKMAGIPKPSVFLISNLDLNLYDFSLLNQALVDGLPCIKKSVYILALPNLNSDIVEKKRKELKKRVWMFATLSGGIGAVPVPGVSLASDIGILIGGIIHFRQCLGLSDSDLERLAKRAGKSVEDLKAVITTPLVGGEITPDIITRLAWGAAAVTVSAMELALNFVPVVGSIFGAGSSFLMTYKLLNAALHDLAENAQRVVTVAFESKNDPTLTSVQNQGETSDCLENQTVESSNSSFFTQQELNKLKSDYETGGAEMVKTVLQWKVTELDNTELNVAVTGVSGAGKSSFINAIRGLQPNDKGAVKVGIGKETIKKPTGYQHPNLPNVCFWDLPGIGTTKFPASKYLNEMKLKKYDFFIIISACRFTENDTILAKEIKRLGKNFYFVRSKIDQDLHSERRGGGIFNEEEELVKIREDCVSELQMAGIPKPSVFLISNLDLNLYDFSLLNQALVDGLPCIKKSVYILALPNLNSDIVEKKRKELKKRVWMLATLSGVIGAVPVPGVSLASDIGILIGGIIHFRQCLGLNDFDLERLAKRAGKSVEDLKAVITTPLVGGKITPDIITRLAWGAAAVTVSAMELALDIIPVVGSIFGAGSSFFKDSGLHLVLGN